MNTKEMYASLETHLNHAYEQASTGKGNIRHANGVAFEKQDICQIGLRKKSIDFNLGQVEKKCHECATIIALRGYQAGMDELYGAINYLAGACEILRVLSVEAKTQEDDVTYPPEA